MWHRLGYGWGKWLELKPTATYIIGCCSYFHKWYFVLEQIFHMLPAGIIFKHVFVKRAG